MKHLLTGVAVVAALAVSAPVWAQSANPSGGNSMGMPGPNPGGPGLTPYSTGQRSAPPPAAMAPSAEAPSMTESTSAMPPRHHAHRGKMAAHHRGKEPQPAESTAEQLNQEEYARLQAGNTPMPPPEPTGPAPAPSRRPPIGGGPGSNLPGPKQSGGY